MSAPGLARTPRQLLASMATAMLVSVIKEISTHVW